MEPTGQLGQIEPAALWRRIAGFLLLFALYQAAEGVGARLFHSATLAAIFMIAAVGATWPVSRFLGFRRLDAYALFFEKPWLRLVLTGLLLSAAVRLAAVFLGVAAGVYQVGPPSALQPALALLGPLTLTVLSTFVASIAEDILTRGFWLRASGLAWTGVTFVAGTSAIYVLNHIYKLADGPVEWLRLFCFGLTYAAACWRWQNLWAAVGLHWGWNLTNGLLDNLVSFDVLIPSVAPFLSAAAHLLIAVIVWVLPPGRSSPQRVRP